ncbi:MAG: WG repeat-containing protein, partial [Oscillospiraceae bacterium]|nr:WG repeat-containing protein [Oscillospiraceae bacterium]
MLLFCVLTAQPCAKASSAELRDGRGVSGLVSGEAFDVHTLPEAAEDIGLTVTVSEKYANGIIVFQYGDRFGLMDGSCRILQQPDYSAVYPVYRTAEEGEEQWFPNLLVLAEPSGEVGSYRIFNCRTEKLLGETYHAVGFYFGGNAQAYASYLERGNHILLEGCFLPVYRTGEGYGMLDLEGECIIACEYEDYRLVHPRRMLMDRLENGHSNELFDETGTALAAWYGYSFPLSGSYHDGLACVECFVSNASEPENGAQEPVRGYVDMEGNWAFTLQENYNAYDSLRDFSEGLAAVMFEDPVSGASYPLYFDTSGNQRLCLDWLCEEVQGEFPEQNLRVEATDFHEGRAFVSFYSYGTCLAKYLLYAGGNVTRLSPEHGYEAFYFNSALVDAAYGDAGSNLLSRWGYLLMDNRYSSVRYLGGNNARWA